MDPIDVPDVFEQDDNVLVLLIDVDDELLLTLGRLVVLPFRSYRLFKLSPAFAKAEPNLFTVLPSMFHQRLHEVCLFLMSFR